MPKTRANVFAHRVPETLLIKVSKDMKDTLTKLAHDNERSVGAQVRFLLRAQLKAPTDQPDEEYIHDGTGPLKQD